MSTVVYQGLQSCLETQPVEQRTLRLKLASPKPLPESALPDSTEKCHYEEGGSKTNSPLGGWSFIYSLSNGCQGEKEAMEKKSPYVHPLVKRSASTLNEKSLEMCTEDLGSETGTHAPPEVGESPSREVLKKPPRQPLRTTKENSPNFPPPLTTMSGSNSLQIRPHREDGRLVMEAVKAPTTHTLFQVERSEGRLRLCLLRYPTSNLDWQAAAATEESEGSSDTNGGEEIDNGVEKYEEEDIEEEEEDDDDGDGDGDGYEGEEEEDEEEEEEAEDEEDGEFNRRGKIEGKKNRGVEIEMGIRMRMGMGMGIGMGMGMGKYRRPSRCKEGGGHGRRKGLLNWEPFWVATS